MPLEVEQKFDEEVNAWISEGWLVPCEPPEDGIVPLMAVVQETKGKVRPVLDFRELNKFVQSHTGDSDVCDETLRKWRMVRGRLGILDLRNAYLQIRVNEKLWRYQTVMFKGKFYALTRLGFGLNSAPRIMSTILRKVLSLDPRIQAATDHYVDDIIVNQDVASVAEVSAHLARFGLRTKLPEEFDNARVLGLQLHNHRGEELRWKRGNTIPVVDEQAPMTRRDLFSICGRLVVHYPVASWLRIACSYIKRCSEGNAWKDDVGPITRARVCEVVERLKKHDPVQGVWSVKSEGSGIVWTDASSLALGAVLEIGGRVVEDASWLRKKDDGAHINVAELEAAIKGLSIALKWGLRKIVIMIDSATVFGWLQSLLSGSSRVKVSGLSEMLVRRRLFLVREMRDEFGLDLSVLLVKSGENKADGLTRVPQEWLRKVCDSGGNFKVKEWHEQHHFGVERTLGLARQVNPAVTRKEVEDIVRNCQLCNSIDPAPVRWEKGEVGVPENWKRLAVDVTHFNKEKYLTLVDCGPSRFALWRRIASEDATLVAAELQQVFRERGPPDELLLDNSATFRSGEMEKLCSRWNVRRRFRCAYRPAGNGIVERNHRTIKSRATRAKKSPLDIVFWYNMAPCDDNRKISPASTVHTYRWRNPNDEIEEDDVSHESGNPYHVGDVVVVKPPNARCTTRWIEGVITGIPSANSVEVDGMPRHVADCRSTRAGSEALAADNEEGDRGGDDGGGDPGEIDTCPVPRRSTRERRPPAYLEDFVWDLGGCDDV
jgi:transposase InsO family protein